jgi:CubicO group peptidase (beta-lactamase class C family)
METIQPDPSQNHSQRIETAIHLPSPIRARGWKTIDLLTCMANEYTPGASVAVIEGGEIAWAKSYSLIQAGSSTPVTEETRFQAASISKPVAALTALSLVEEGRLALDEDICRYQTSWRLPQNDGWKPRVTLRMLLSHSAGVNVHGFPGYSQSSPLPSLIQVLKGEKPANTPAIMVDTLPGLQFRYSGGGFCILQQLIEDITSKPFWQAAQERVLEPAGMAESTYQLLMPEAQRVAIAVGHRSDGQPLQGGWHTYPESAAAGLWTTAVDLAKLIVEIEAALQGKREKIISQAMMKEMLSPQVRVRGIGLTGWQGLSLFLTGEKNDWYYGHGGSNEGYRSQMIVRKGTGQAAVIMTNSDQGDAITEGWMDTIALEYGWSGYAWHPPAPVRIKHDQLSKFTGKYQLKNRLILRVSEEHGRLTLSTEQQAGLAMSPRSRNRFFLTQINAEVRFICEKGACTSLIFRQSGEDLPAKLISKE